MELEQAIQEGKEAFVQYLKARAHGQDVPIDATLWYHPANADTVELTVVSSRKSYIFSLPSLDLTDSHRGAIRQEIIGFLLTTIKENIPMVRAQRNSYTTERGHAKGAAQETPMDAKLYASVLREHSEYIGKVMTDLSAQLQQLAQALGEPPGSAPADTRDCVEGVAQLQKMLAAETNIFCKRVQALVETTRVKIASNSPRQQEDSRTPTDGGDSAQPALGEGVIQRGTPSYAAFTEGARKAVDEAREAVAQADQSLARTRDALQRTEELFQYLRARRERDAERQSPLGIAQPPRATFQEPDSPPETSSLSELPTPQNKPE